MRFQVNIRWLNHDLVKNQLYLEIVGKLQDECSLCMIIFNRMEVDLYVWCVLHPRPIK